MLIDAFSFLSELERTSIFVNKQQKIKEAYALING